LILQIQQISIAPVIILKYKTRPMERTPTIMAGMVPVIIVRIIIMERMLVVLEHKKGAKDGCYRLY